MSDYTVGELPIVGYYQLKGSSRYILGGVAHSSHASMYRQLEGKITNDAYLGAAQQAISLGYVFKRGGWEAALAKSYEMTDPDANPLMSMMWALAFARPKRTFMLRYDNHIVRWDYGKNYVGSEPRISVEADGWECEFKAAKLRLFFKRMYEGTV